MSASPTNRFGAWRLISSLLLAAVLSSGESIANGGFEQGLDSWRPTDWKQKAGEVAIDGDAGAKSVKLVNQSPDQTTMAEQDLTLVQGQRYRLTFRMRLDGVVPAEGSKGAGASVMILQAGKHVIEGSVAGTWKQMIGTSDWQTGSFEFVPESIEGKVKLYVVLRSSSGTLWCDDLSIVEVP